jgi:hypothetical protein
VLVDAQQSPDAPSTPASSRPEAGGDGSTTPAAYRAKGSLAPQGWVGDQADLDRARRYRKAARATIHVSWFAVVGYLIVALKADFSLLPVFGVLLILHGGRIFFERKVTDLIGRKWTVSLEMKEKRLELREKR